MVPLFRSLYIYIYIYVCVLMTWLSLQWSYGIKQLKWSFSRHFEIEDRVHLVTFLIPSSFPFPVMMSDDSYLISCAESY